MGSSNFCFVPGCTTGYRSDRKRRKALGERAPSLFRPPRNPLLLHMWRQVIPRADKVISEKDGICELHFAEEDIERYFPRALLPDGTQFYLKKTRPNLKPGAIPTYFAKLPKYSSNLRKLVSKLPKQELSMKKPSLTLLAIEKELHNYYLKVPRPKDAKTAEISEFDADVSQTKKCRITYEKKRVNEKGIKSLISDSVDITAEETVAIGEESLYMSADNLSTSDSENIPEQCENSEKMNVDDINISTNNMNIAVAGEVTYDVLVRNVGLIPKPNSSWGITAHERFIICAMWNEEFMPEKRVIIDCNLNIKVYVRDKEIASYKNWTFSNLSDVTTIMHLIDS